ncbi:MAG: PIG-L family deacetylase [Candidatus Levybacteria bacterium]|nr:PIG-L family deacetylase [Candidatus Levybacteria bacterium]
MKVVFVFAHPDDESFSSAGTIALLTKNGHTVKLITATRGEQGQVGDPPITTQENLGKVREEELRTVTKVLGISEVYFLDFVDGALKETPLKLISGKVLELLREEKPDVVVTFNEEGASLHPDHIRMHEAATDAFKEYVKGSKKHLRLYYNASPRSFIQRLKKMGIMYSVYGEVMGIPDDLISTKIDISQTVDKKIKALMSHKTQHKDWEKYLKRKDHKEFKYEFFRLVMENTIV